MSADKTSDDSQKRLGRLKAMQSKHQPVAAPAAAAKPGPMAGLRGGGGAAAGSIQQKLRKALTGPDGKIDQKKARMFLMMIRKQAADPAAPRHEMAKKIAEKIKSLPAQQRQRLMAMAGLGGAAGPGGAAMGGADMNHLAAGPRGARQPAATQAGADATGEAWFDNLVDKL